MSFTHVTEFGLRYCAGLEAAHRRTTLLADTVACTGELVCETALLYPDNFLFSEDAVVRVPTCPRCAVLRDEALEGRLPKRETKT